MDAAHNKQRTRPAGPRERSRGKGSRWQKKRGTGLNRQTTHQSLFSINFQNPRGNEKESRKSAESMAAIPIKPIRERQREGHAFATEFGHPDPGLPWRLKSANHELALSSPPERSGVVRPAVPVSRAKMRVPHVSLLRPGFTSAEQRLHHIRRAAQSSIELTRVLTACLGHVRPSAAGTSDALRK